MMAPLSRVALLEDSAADVYLVRETIATLQHPIELTVIVDFEAGMAALEDGSLRSFDAMLIDIDLGKGSGLDILRRIRAEENGTHMPIAVVTSSDAPRDKDAAMRGGADLFIPKPMDYDLFVTRVGKAIQQMLGMDGSAPRLA